MLADRRFEWSGVWDCMILIHTKPSVGLVLPMKLLLHQYYAHQAAAQITLKLVQVGGISLRDLLPVNYFLPLQMKTLQMKTLQTRRNIVLVLQSFRSMSTIQRRWIPGKSTGMSIH